MPKLLLFAGCERVSFDSSDKSPSLLGVLQGFTVTVGPLPLNEPLVAVHEMKDDIPPPAAIPIRWVAFSLWKRVPEDKGKKFVQVCELISPSGKSVGGRHPGEFEMTAGFHRHTVNIHGFPINEQGDYVLRLSLIEDDGEAKVIKEYPISVVHVPPDVKEEPAK